MKEGPDIALVASLIGDPARANMLTAMMNGKAYTATELAAEGGISPQTASTHLKKLETGGLIRQRKQGRHRYFSLSGPQVGVALEALMGLAEERGHTRMRTGPKDPALRHARVCYDHLAGELAVMLFDGWTERGFLTQAEDEISVTPTGDGFFRDLGFDMEGLIRARRPLCKSCLDWSMRRTHLAGALGREVLEFVYREGWASRVDGTRAVRFTQRGEEAFRTHFLPAA